MGSKETFCALFNPKELQDIFDKSVALKGAIGRDGQSVEAFRGRIKDELSLIERKALNCTYKFTAYSEKLVSKGAGKRPRQLSKPTVRDKVTLKALSKILVSLFPSAIPATPHSIVRDALGIIRGEFGEFYYVRLDIQEFFPSIDHDILMRLLRRRIRYRPILHLVKDAIRTPTGVKKSEGSLNQVGIPQGLSISSALASIYLADMDEELSSLCSGRYFRYVDDVLFVCKPSEAEEIARRATEILQKKRKISCHPVGTGGKSVIVPGAQGIDYIGYHFSPGLLRVRTSSVRKYLGVMVTEFSKCKQAGLAGSRLWRLNLRITGCIFDGKRIGWMFFFSQTEDVSQLKRIDAFIKSRAGLVSGQAEASRVKRLVRAYHEIKYNLHGTKYIPNFDKYGLEDKRRDICLLAPHLFSARVESMTADEINAAFRTCINKEISDIEKDLLEAFS
ncbi:RNA-directed DNA polymerase [Rhodobacter capsulatus]|jgi:retron-type reverse transcriptase|uniref:Reverse transcriptase family protein n=1 Tax=Rhodobacter capsulatus (strain ATCC BAA-309 / NBRC 16581 / SB1003) TaxID=272942 RepID=D5ASD0_RHOCB|nr:RNA-directed DNA polymerase [Rhodobacter capsulatus]ADE85021.1 reverse transcriptase family protein [Rhodobacter capsulatus SB 1003]MDS0926675.1 RNA-directed DNA polymerase [Rhodobacter capsulatus]